MKVEIEPAALAKLEEIAEQNRDLSPDEKERLSEKIGQDTPEFGTKMRELFAKQRLDAKLDALEAETGKAETLTVLPAQWKRRPLPPDPDEEMVTKKAKADLFISPKLQPEIGVEQTHNRKPEPEKPVEPKQDEAISLNKLLAGLGAQKREELFKTLLSDDGGGKALTTTQPLAFQHSKSPSGIPQSLENALVAIDKLNIDCKYDIFHDRVVVSEHQIGLRGDVLNNIENVALKVRQAVLLRFRFDPGINFTFDALKLMCLDRVFDPVFDYLEGLQWDGVPRLDSWLIDYCGANETDLNRAWTEDARSCRAQSAKSRLQVRLHRGA